mgnify:CR=1 FL=1
MVEGGVMNADEKARELGLPGITNAVEDVIVARDILLAKETGVQLHLCHCSTADSVKMLALAKEEGMHLVSLGKRILRTETAGLATLSILMYHIESVSEAEEERDQP